MTLILIFWLLSEYSLSSLWVLSKCSLTVLWSLSECSDCSLIDLWPLKMKIDCSGQTCARQTDTQTDTHCDSLSSLSQKGITLGSDYFSLEFLSHSTFSSKVAQWKIFLLHYEFWIIHPLYFGSVFLLIIGNLITYRLTLLIFIGLQSSSKCPVYFLIGFLWLGLGEAEELMDPTFLALSLTILETLTLFFTLRSSACVTSLADTGRGFLNNQDMRNIRLKVQQWVHIFLRVRGSLTVGQEAKTIPEANQKNVIGLESATRSAAAQNPNPSVRKDYQAVNKSAK